MFLACPKYSGKSEIKSKQQYNSYNIYRDMHPIYSVENIWCNKPVWNASQHQKCAHSTQRECNGNQFLLDKQRDNDL